MLEVYYGFNAVYLRMFGTAKRDSMLEKLKQPGIEYFGASHACARGWRTLSQAGRYRTAARHRTGRGSGSHSD